jgi:hypothetical protein
MKRPQSQTTGLAAGVFFLAKGCLFGKSRAKSGKKKFPPFLSTDPGFCAGTGAAGSGWCGQARSA